jgi:4-alpha-glucanotransferase
MVDEADWGVARGYHDALGHWREPPSAVVDEILSAMGAHSGRLPPQLRVISRRPDRDNPPLPAGQLLLEDGSTAEISAAIPQPDLPVGYHHLVPRDGGKAFLVLVSPGRCFLPPGLRTWGWAIQLYAARSSASWGIGDLSDLAWLGRWSAGRGAGLALINPLHAPLPTPDQQSSPYSASSRCFSNPLYLRVEEVPGAADLDTITELANAARALNADRLIDRDAVWRIKSAALEQIFRGFSGDDDFDRFCAQRGTPLEGYATFAYLAEHFGGPWHEWPEQYRRPDAAAASELVCSAHGRTRTRYHAWLQWHLDRQLQRASRAVGLVQDLAIGASPGGADTWIWQDVYAQGFTVGAPPDEFNTLGQNWGLPPWDPWRLAEAEFVPFIQTVRAGLRHSGGLRFDHVMGLFRLYWIPPDRPAYEGTYVRYPWAEMLDILAIESHRSGAFVVGEDLGTVEEFVRPELAERGVLSYRLLWFEHEWPDRWPEQTLAAVSTHDLPTVAGLWTGSDLAAQRRAGQSPNEAAIMAIRRQLAERAGLDDNAELTTVISSAYRLLATSPSAVLTATLDDALSVEERPNMPGTTDQWPNWCLALPVPIEELESSGPAAEIGGYLDRKADGADVADQQSR